MKLDKRNMIARQGGVRCGDLHCEMAEDHVFIGGQARTFMTGKVFIL